jgi:hypothetical protein
MGVRPVTSLTMLLMCAWSAKPRSAAVSARRSPVRARRDTPYHQTERDLKRLNNVPGLMLRDYDGGHMTYFDDRTRAAQKADLRAFYARTIAP